MVTSKVHAEVLAGFAAADQSRVMEALQRYGGPEAERVRSLIVRLAKRDPARVDALIETARQDYRDVLSADRSAQEKIRAYLVVAAVLVFVFAWRFYGTR